MNSPSVTSDLVQQVTNKLMSYCEVNQWAGYEPYDALNSKVLEAFRLTDFKVPRLLLTQLLKRSPINVRGLLLIPKSQNPKALGLFLSAFTKLAQLELGDQHEHVRLMVQRLRGLRSQSGAYWSWGYNFPWQTRTDLVARWQPNLVCTSFAAMGLLDAYELTGDTRCLEMATSSAEFLVDQLYWSDGNRRCGFGYPLPTVHNQVHNANFLAADLLCRVYKCTGEEKFLSPALNSIRYSVAQQQADGGWVYGEADTQKWIDNFHTGFNLSALESISKHLGTTEFEASLRRGVEFYRAHFFRNDGAPRYFHNRTYPIDAHSVAQSIITLLDLKDIVPENMALAKSVFQWAMRYLWDDKGFFYYRTLRLCTIRTSYMRWTQAWMLLALSTLLKELLQEEERSDSRPKSGVLGVATC